MNEERKQFVIYSRKSKITGKGESIENQIELCRQYIACHYSTQDAENALVYEDEGFSGGTLDRPQFRRMMCESHDRPIVAIVVYRLDRISRNIGDFAGLIDDLGQRGIEFISIKEQFDTSSPMGRAMMYIASVFSQLERETIAERIRDNMHELARTGRWLGGVTPLGFTSEAVSMCSSGGKMKKMFRLLPVPQEIRIVRRIFHLFAETVSLSETEMLLRKEEIRTRAGNPFTRFALRSILSNPVYMCADEAAWLYLRAHNADLSAEKMDFDGSRGVMVYNRTEQHPGRTHKRRPMEEWIVSVGEHQGVIAGEDWIRVQELLARNASQEYRKPRSNAAILPGMLFCGECGAPMRPKLTGRIRKDGQPDCRYVCTAKERDHRCSMKDAPGNALEAEVMQTIGGLAPNREEQCAQLLKLRKSISGMDVEQNAEIVLIREQIAENESAIRNLLHTLEHTGESDVGKYIAEQIQECDRRGKVLKKRLEELEWKADESETLSADLLLDILMENPPLSILSVEQKRNAVRLCFDRIVWDGETAHLYMRGSASEEIPVVPSCVYSE
ncbi:MAG: recombinase family protein [Ruminococcaceae bacterium]|nr:recombinase family protein [Oscillospiraceae bacterium]